jgi:hypothetical protein
MGKTTNSISIKGVKSPSHRFNAVKAFSTRPNFNRIKRLPPEFTQYQIALVSRIKQEDTPYSDVIEEALTIFKIPVCRAVMDGLVVSGSDDPFVSRVAECPLDVVHCYKDLFFDPTVFSNRLITIAFIRSLPCSTDFESFRKKMLSWGYHLGGEYIAWKIGVRGSIISKTPEASVSDVLTDASWRSREHLLSDISDSPAKEARAWVPQVLKSAEIIKAFGNDKPVSDSLNDLVFDLRGVDETISINDIEDVTQ